MRTGAFALLIAATPALAQVSVPSRGGQQQVLADIGARGLGDLEQRARRFDHPTPSDSLERAGAWGRCVVTAEPALARDYAAGGPQAAALKPVFDHCYRQIGWTGVLGDAAFRRAAIGDALAIPR